VVAWVVSPVPTGNSSGLPLVVPASALAAVVALRVQADRLPALGLARLFD
jgi:hypothetical protein